MRPTTLPAAEVRWRRAPARPLGLVLRQACPVRPTWLPSSWPPFPYDGVSDSINSISGQPQQHEKQLLTVQPLRAPDIVHGNVVGKADPPIPRTSVQATFNGPCIEC